MRERALSARRAFARLGRADRCGARATTIGGPRRCSSTDPIRLAAGGSARDAVRPANNRRPPAEARRRVIQARIFAVVADCLAEPSSLRAPPCAWRRRAAPARRVVGRRRRRADCPNCTPVAGNPRTPEDAALVARAARRLACMRRGVAVAARIEALLSPPAPGGGTGGDSGGGDSVSRLSFCRRDPKAARRAQSFGVARDRVRGDGAARATEPCARTGS